MPLTANRWIQAKDRLVKKIAEMLDHAEGDQYYFKDILKISKNQNLKKKQIEKQINRREKREAVAEKSIKKSEPIPQSMLQVSLEDKMYFSRDEFERGNVSPANKNLTQEDNMYVMVEGNYDGKNVNSDVKRK